MTSLKLRSSEINGLSFLGRNLFLVFICILLCITKTHAQEVMPDSYQEPGIYPYRDYLAESFNEYIDPFTGGLNLHYIDLQIPGNGGFDLKVIRSYNSSFGVQIPHSGCT